MAWESVSENVQVKAGETYRLGIQVKAPFSTTLGDVIVRAIKLGDRLRNLDPFQKLHNTIEVRRVYYAMPLQGSRTGRSEPWWIYVEFIKRTSNPVLPVIYGLIALIVVASSAVLISGKSFERFAANVGESVQGVTREVFNPGVILAAFILGFMFLKSRATA